MFFNSISFILFFLCFFLLYRFLTKKTRQKIWLIFFGSLFFYGAWDYRFVPLLVFTALVDFYLARVIASNPSGSRKRKGYLCLSITMNLAVLGFFKYTNFFLDNAVGILSLFGKNVGALHLDIILPIGISFYTFQSMSYVIDVYRGELTARKHPEEFLAGVSFFPHLVAGPIIRATTLLPQFEAVLGEVERKDWERGALLFFAGLCKKGMADLLAFYADLLFQGKGTPNMIEAWTGSLAFAGQIYGDFSGYTDMAIGIALFLGIKLPPNFNLPYLATSAVDFWKRWHISLSTWMKDYLYIPLGGNRCHGLRNLVITMFLGGLWHGAAWTFVIWGLYHGILLVVTHIVRSVIPPSALATSSKNRLMTMGKIMLNFYLVLIGWIIFRSSTMHQSWLVIRSMHGFAKPGCIDIPHCTGLLIVIILLVGGHLLDILIKSSEHRDVAPPWIWGCAGALLALGFSLSGKSQPFIYFQF